MGSAADPRASVVARFDLGIHRGACWWMFHSNAVGPVPPSLWACLPIALCFIRPTPTATTRELLMGWATRRPYHSKPKNSSRIHDGTTGPAGPSSNIPLPWPVPGNFCPGTPSSATTFTDTQISRNTRNPVASFLEGGYKTQEGSGLRRRSTNTIGRQYPPRPTSAESTTIVGNVPHREFLSKQLKPSDRSVCGMEA